MAGWTAIFSASPSSPAARKRYLLTISTKPAEVADATVEETVEAAEVTEEIGTRTGML